MPRTTGDIIGAALVRGNVTTTSAGLFTDTVMGSFLNDAHRWATGYKKWPITEGRYSTTWSGTEETMLPEGWRSDSVRYMTIGSKEVKKVNFYDYQRYKEENTGGADRIFTDHFRILFVNPGADVSGTMTVYGQYVPAAFDLTDPASVTPFSDSEDNANEALVEEILSYMKERDGKPDESKLHHDRATVILEGVWSKIMAEQSGYTPHDSSMFERLDVMSGDYWSDTLKRDQWY